MNEEINQSNKDSLHFVEENNNNNNNTQYQYGLDLVRFVAMFLVVTLHAQDFNGLPKTNINTFPLFLLLLGKYISYACNGLFMMLTGYLKSNKKPSSSYFPKIIQFILEYLLCAIACTSFSIYHVGKKLTKEQVLDGIIIFAGVTHGWFVRMYIGLFLLSPFLNILYNNIKTVKGKYELIIIIIIVYSLPYSYYKFGWRYWGEGYPVMYYFVGCFIKEYQININRIYNISLILIIAIILSFLDKYSSVAYVNNCQNLGCVILTSLIFLLFYNLKAQKKNCICKIFRKITDTSFSFFLLQYFFEQYFYYELFPRKGYNTFIKRLPHLFYIVPINVIGGILCSLITHFLTVYIMKIIYHIIDVIKDINKKEKMEGLDD